MAIAIHKITKEVKLRANTPDFPTVDWFIFRRISVAAIAQINALIAGGIPSRYWNVDQSNLDPALWTVTEQNAAGKLATDTANAVTDRPPLRKNARNTLSNYLEKRYDDGLIQNFLVLASDAQGSKPNRLALIKTVFAWQATVMQALDTYIDSINAAPAPIQLAPFNPAATFNATDPNVSLKNVLNLTT